MLIDIVQLFKRLVGSYHIQAFHKKIVPFLERAFRLVGEGEGG